MAVVTQTLTSTLTRRNFVTPAATSGYGGLAPIAEVKATSSETILAKGISDEGVYSFSTILPSDFVYRLVELRIQLASVNVADLDNFERAMEFVFTENQVTSKRFQCVQENFFYTALDAQIERNPGVTNPIVNAYMPANPYGLFTDVIDASQGQSIMLGVILDNNAAATNAVATDFYARFLQYTVDQLNSGAMWTSIPVVA